MKLLRKFLLAFRIPLILTGSMVIASVIEQQNLICDDWQTYIIGMAATYFVSLIYYLLKKESEKS